ncbi:unnamed protein product [Closterium sp. NIES-54]
MVTTTTPGGQRVSICTCTRTGRHLATFTRRTESSLYTLATEPPQVVASAQVSVKSEVSTVLISWIRTVRLQLRERFGQDLPILRLHSDRGGEFSSDLLRDFCRGEGITQSFTLPNSPKQNGITECRIGLVMEVARTSMIHAAAPHFLWPFVVRYAAHQLNLWPRVSLPETSPTLRWTGKVGDASVFWVWGSRAFVRDTSTDKLSARAIPCVFLGFVLDAPGWQFYHPTSRRVLPTQDVTFDKSVPFYRLFPYRSAPPPPPPLFLAPGPPPVDPLPPQGPDPSGVSQVDPLPRTTLVQVAVVSGAARGAASGGAASGGAEPGGAGSEGAGSGGPAGASPRLTSQQLREWLVRRLHHRSGAPGAGGAEDTKVGGAVVPTGAVGTGGVGCAAAGDPTEPVAAGTVGTGAGVAGVGGPGAGCGGVAGAGVGGTGAGGAGAAGAGAIDPGNGGTGDTVRPRSYFVPFLQHVLGVSSTCLPPPFLCPLPNQSQPLLQPASPLPAPSPYTEQSGGLTERREPASRPVSPVRTAHHAPRTRPPPVPGTHTMALRPSSVPLRVPLLAPPESPLPEVPDPESDRARAASPTVARLLATAVTDPYFESAAASALVAELLDFAAACRLNYATALIAESVSASPPSVGVPCLASMLLAPEGDQDAPDIPTPRSYAEAITGPYSSQWQAAMDAEMASWKSTGTYVDEVPPPGANIVDGMWIFRVKRSLGSPPAFMARYVARGFSQRQGVDYLQTFSPTSKMTTLCVLLHVAAQRDYELHSLDISTAFLQGSLHEEIWLNRPPGFSTSGMGLVLGGRGPVVLTSHADASWVDNSATQRSSQGYTFSLGATLALLLADRLGRAASFDSSPVRKAMIALCQEHRLEQRTKYIALRYFLARELQQRGQLRLAYVATQANTADVFTKALQSVRHVGAASASGKRCSSNGKGGRSGGGGSRGCCGGGSGGDGGSGGGGSGGSGGGSGGFGGGGGGSGESVGSGSGGGGGSRDGAVQRGCFGGGQRQKQQRRSETPSPLQLRDRAGQTCGKPQTQHRCFSRLDDAWRTEFGDEAECPCWAELLWSGVVIFDLDYDAILAAMYALSVSAEGDCYLCMPPDRAIEAAALGASDSSLPGTAPAEALHTFTLDSGASRYFFRDSTTLTPLPAPVPVRLADPSVGPVLACSSTFLPCLAVAAFAHVSASGPVAPPCSCRLLSHQTLLWHHFLGHPSLPRLRGMHSRLLVSSLPRSLPPLPPSPAPPCLPCIEGRQCAAPHSSFPPTTAPLRTFHLDVWGPARVSGQDRERYVLLVVDNYTRYTTVFPLRSKSEVPDVLIPWICAVRLQLRERFCAELPVLRLHFDRGVMEVARTSMIHAAAPYFLWPFAVRYAAHQLNLWPRVSFPETSPTLCWTGKVGDASMFQVWGSRAFVRDTSAYKLSARAIPCSPVSLGVSQVDPIEPIEVDVDSGAAGGVVSWGDASRGDESAGAEPGGNEPVCTEPEGVEPWGAEPEHAEPGGAEPGGAELERTEPGGTLSTGGPPGALSRREPLSPPQLREWFARRTLLRSGAARDEGSAAGGPGTPGLGGTGVAGPGAAGPGGARTGAAGPGGAPTGGTGAAGAGGAVGVGAGDPGAGDPGAGETGAGGAGPGGARTGGTGAAGPGGARTRGTGAARAEGAAGVGVGGIGAGAAGGTRAARAGATCPGGARPGGTRAAGAGGAAGVGAVDPGAGDTRAGGASPGGAGAVGAGSGDTGRPRPYFVPVLQQVLGVPSSTGLTPPLLCPPPDQSQPPLQPASPLPTPSPYIEQTGGLTELREPVSRLASPVCAVRTGRRVPRPHPPLVPGTHHMALRPSSVPLRVPLPSPPASSLADGPDPESYLVCAASPTVPRLLAHVFTDPSFDSAAASALVAELVDFVATCRLDYVTSLLLSLSLSVLRLSGSTPLPTGPSLSAPPSDESVEPSGPYPESVGCLMYLMTCTRPDLAYPLSILARYVAPERYRPEHWEAAKRVLRYLWSTSGMGLLLGEMGPVVLTEPLGAASTMAGPEERGGRGAGGSGEAQAQGQPRDSAMAPVQPSLGPPGDEHRVFGLDNPWVRKSAQGYLLLGQALGSSQIRHIKPFQRESEKGPKAWAALKGVHAPATAAVVVVLEWQMAALRIEEDEAVEEGVQKFFDLLTRLEGADLNYSELQKKTKLLALLLESWSSLIINLNRDLPRLSLEDVKRAILQEDFRRRELDLPGQQESGGGGSIFGSNNFNGGHGSGGYCSDNNSYGRGRGRFDGECHYCHKSGHMCRDFFKLPDGWTPAQGQEGRGVGGRGRGRGGRGGRGGGAASIKSAGNEGESRDDRFPGQFFFVSTQAPAGPEKNEGFEEPEAVGKVTLHSLDYWVIDSGATYSMTPRADLLIELEPSPVKHVTSALGQRAEVKGMGKAMFKGADGKMVGLKNVLWVPNLAANLISVRRLQKAGMDTSLKGAKTYTARLDERILWDLHEDRGVYNEMWQIPVVPMPKERQVAASISTKGEVVGSGDGANGRAKEIGSKKCNLGGTSKRDEHKESGAVAKKQHKDEEKPMAALEEEYGESMWGTIASAAFSNPTSATGECDWLTLHRRMGHVALSMFQQLVKNEMVAGIRVKGEPDEVLVCPTCMQAKFTRYSFSSSEATAKAPLDEVVMDVVGPMKLGAAGAKYFITILDVYTRMNWVYVLSKKSDVAETVKTDRLPMVERQQDRLVKAICTDQGGEFLSKEFSLWLKKNGIRHSLTMPYSPAMNGIAERASRTITETARGLLIEAGLPTISGLMRCGDWKVENEAKIGMWFGEVKSSGLGLVELPLELSSGSTTTRQSSLVNGGEEANDAEEEEEEVQQKAMESELKSIEENDTWELLELPEGRKAITSKWLFKIKSDADGKIERYKSRIVAKGYQQKEIVDYKELFAPVVKPTTLRTLLAGAAIKGWVVKQMDVTTAFLNGVHEEEIFMAQPEGQWCLKLRGVLEEIGFTPSSADHSLFMLGEGEQRSFMVVYVDDILIFSPSSDLVKEVMLKLQDNRTSLHCPPVSSSPLRFSARSPPPHVLNELGQVAASSQVSASSQLAASCSSRVLSHQTLLWHHCLGHPSLLRLRGMHSRLLVCGLPMSLPSLPRSHAPPCLPCVEGRQRAAPLSSEFPPTTAPMQTLHLDADVIGVLIPWIRATRRQLRERFSRDFPVLRLHSNRGGEFSSDLLAEFCQDEGILQSFTFTASPQQNGIAERRIGLIMEVACTSMIHAAAPHFLWPFAVRYATHQLNLWPRVSEPETSPTLRWTGKVGDTSVFRATPTRVPPGPPSASFLGTSPPPPVGPAPSRVSQVDPPPLVEPLEVSSDSSGRVEGRDPAGDDTAATRRSPRFKTPPGFLPRPSSPPPQPSAVDSGAETAGAEPRGAETKGESSGGAATRGAATRFAATAGAGSGGDAIGVAGSWGAVTGGADSGGPASPSGSGAVGDPTGGPRAGQPPQPDLLETLSPQAIRTAGAGGTVGTAGAGVAGATCLRGATGTGGAGGTASAGGAGAGGTGDTGGASAAGAGGAGGATRATSTGGAGGTTGARGPGAVGASGAAGAGGAGGAAGAAGAGGAGGAGTGGAGAAGTALHRPFFYPQPQSSLLPPDSVLRQVTESLTERREPETRASTPVHARRVTRPRPPALPSTHDMALRPSSVPQRVVLPEPSASSLPHILDPGSDLACAASPTVTHLLATIVTDPDLESTAAFSLVTELVDFAATSCLDYVASLVTEPGSVCPPSIGGEIALGSDELEDRQFELECLAAALPRFASMLLCPAGDLDALDIPTRALTLRRSRVLQRFGFQFSLPQPTPLSTSHSLSAPPSDELVELSRLYLELVGCLMYLMTCTRPDLTYPLSLLACYVAPGRHRKRLEHRTKHIALRYFLARELQWRRQFRLSYVASQANNAVLTKALGSGDHQRFCTALGLVPTLRHLVVA